MEGNREDLLRRAVVLVVFGGCLAAYLGRQYLAWDGAFQLFYMFQEQGQLHGDRFTVGLLLRLPSLVANALTDDFSTRVGAYGVVYSFIPFICVGLVAYVLKDRIELVVVAVIGICATTLLYQYFWIHEHRIVCHVFWVLLAVMARNSRTAGSTLAMAVLTIVIFFLQPVAGGLLLVAATFAVALDVRAIHNWVAGGLLGALGALRLSMLFDNPEEASEVNAPRLLDLILWEVPLGEWLPQRDFALLYMGLCAAAVLLPLVPRLRARARWIRWVVLLAAAVCLFAWLHSHPRSIAYGLRTRHLIVFNCLVPYAAFMWIAWLSRKTPAKTPDASLSRWLSPTYGIAVGAVFLVFLTDVSLLRQRHLAAADAWLRGTDSSCETMLAYTTDHQTFLEHWALTYEHLLWLGSRRPDVMFVDAESCDSLGPGEEGEVKLSTYGTAFPRRGYFDLTEALPPPSGTPSEDPE